MIKQSKFKDNQVNVILNDIVTVLERHQATTDLSLIVLGNMVTHLLNNNVGKQQRKVLAQAFSDALTQSIAMEK